MGAKIHDMGSGRFAFQCPGCHGGHMFVVPRWNWNGNYEKPTVQPSINCNKDDPKTNCHSNVNDGMIKFEPDSYHELKGQTVEIPDWDS